MTKKILLTQSTSKKYKILRVVVIAGYIFVCLLFLFVYFIPNGFDLLNCVAELFMAIIAQTLVICFLHIFLTFNIEVLDVYENRIESRISKGIKNIVYFKDLKQIKEVKLITGKTIYVFDDGRKNGLFNICKISELNNLRYNLRIEKTEELEQFILTNLRDKLVCNEGISSNGLD